MALNIEKILNKKGAKRLKEKGREPVRFFSEKPEKNVIFSRDANGRFLSRGSRPGAMSFPADHVDNKIRLSTKNP